MITPELAQKAKDIVSGWDSETQNSFKEKYNSLKDDSQRETVLTKVLSQYGDSSNVSSSPSVKLSEDELNIKDPFPYLNWIPGGKELNKKLVDTATRVRDENPSAFHLMNMEAQTKAGVVEGFTGGVPRAIIEKVTGYEMSKGNIAGRILGSLVPVSYVGNAVKAKGASTLVKNAVEGAVAMNLVEGIPADEFFDLKKRIKLSAVGGATGVAIPIGIKAGVKTAEAILSIPKSAINESVKVIGRVLNATHIQDFAYGKNPPEAVVEALGKDLPSSSFQELQSKVQAAIPRYVQKARDVITQKQGNKLINLSDKLNSELDTAIDNAIKGGKNNQALVTRLMNLKDAINYNQTVNHATGEIVKGSQRILDGISPSEAVIFKQEIGKLAKWTGNASDDKLVNMTTKKLYGITNSEIVKAVPESAKLNEIISGLMSADNLLNRKVAYEYGEPMFKGAGKIVGTAGALYGLATGNPKAIIASLEVLGISKISQSVEAQTKLAYGLSKLGKSAQIDILTRYPKLKPLVDPIMKKFSTSTLAAVKTVSARAATAASRYSAPLVEEKIKESQYA